MCKHSYGVLLEDPASSTAQSKDTVDKFTRYDCSLHAVHELGMFSRSEAAISLSTSLRVSIHHSTSKTTYQYLHHVPPLPLNGDSPAWLRSCLAHDSLLITLVPITSRNHSTHSPPYGSSCHLLPSLPPSLPLHPITSLVHSLTNPCNNTNNITIPHDP